MPPGHESHNSTLAHRSGSDVGGVVHPVRRNHTRPRIDDILTGFFADALEDQTGVARRRILAVEQRLRQCIEAEGDRMLTTSPTGSCTAVWSASSA
jgi:hypothetical protein